MKQYAHTIQKGFTLIELLVVLAIIGMVTSLVMVNILGARERGRDATRKSDLRALQAYMEMYRADQGSYPSSPLPVCGGSLIIGGSTYIPKMPCDPTNTGQYVYKYTTTGTTYTLVTCLENEKDAQRDKTNNASFCSGIDNWSFTLTNP